MSPSEGEGHALLSVLDDVVEASWAWSSLSATFDHGEDSMTWMLTGGAGYIGGHVLRALQAAGEQVVVLDDLSTGDPRRVPHGVPLEVASVLDGSRVVKVLQAYGVRGVIHLAGKKAVEESVRLPLRYYHENAEGVRRLLQAMSDADVRRLVFSSSAAVYAPPTAPLVTEDAPTVPQSPYGRSKLVGEWMVADAAGSRGFGAVSLRYFNVVGNAAPELADRAGTNLFPRILDALRGGRRPTVFGLDYPTPDGSGVRDYIHVADLADAHVAATRLTADPGHAVLNVGCGRGYSVLEVLDAFAAETGLDTTPEIFPRRAGDAASVVADPGRAAEVLGWRARHHLADMVASAWEAERSFTAIGSTSGSTSGPTTATA
jgi:UDP-glucose 4-epimerase